MPSWNAGLNKFFRSEVRTPVAAAVKTTTGNTGTLNADFVAFDFLVTTASPVGAGTVTITVEESTDGTTWVAVSGASSGAISTAQAASRVRGLVIRAYYRVVWTITGTSISVGVSGNIK